MIDGFDGFDGFDGLVFLVPEYNRSFPGALKNALGYVCHREWNDKAAGIVSYGGHIPDLLFDAVEDDQGAGVITRRKVEGQSVLAQERGVILVA